MSVTERAEKIAPEINAMIAATDRSHHQQIQSLNYELLKKLSEAGLSYVEEIHHRYVGVLPCNRNYEMLDPQNVHRSLLKITNKGFNPSMPKPVGQELAPNNEGSET